MVYSSSRLCSSFSVVSYSLLFSRVCYPNGALLSALMPRSLRSLPAFLFFFLFSIFTLCDARTLFLILSFRQFSAILIFLFSYIYFFNTYVYAAELFSILYSHLLGFILCFLVLSARVLCTLITSVSFLLPLLVMLLALTRFNFFHDFFSLTKHFLIFFCLQPARYYDFCNYVLATFHNIIFKSILMWVTVG